MTDIQKQGQLRSQTSIISLDKYKFDQFIRLEKNYILNDELQIQDKRSNFYFEENSQINNLTKFQADSHKNLQISNNMSKKISQQSTQILKKTSSFQEQNIKNITTLSKFFSDTKEKEVKIKISFKDRTKQGHMMKSQQFQNKIVYIQNEKEESLEENNQCFQFDLAKEEYRIQNIQMQKYKIFSDLKTYEMKNLPMISLINNKKTKTRELGNNQNYCEQLVQQKQIKSMKKVAFEDLSVDSPKKGHKTCKIFAKNQKIVDDTGSQASKSSFYETKNSKYSRSSMKLMSQVGSLRMIKVVGPKKDTFQLMLKEVQIKNQQIQRKQQQLYKISHQNKHPNILRMYSKNKIFRENKIYLQIKMQVYETNLVNYLIQNEQSTSVAIQRKIILFQIIKGLNFLHSKKIYHRDLNPFNVIIGERLRVFLTNFAFIQNPQPTQYSQKNYYECNSFIRPPQIILNPLRPFDKGGDIWAIGCIIVFMLKGDMPFKDYSDADLILQMIKFLGKPSKQYLQSINFKGNRRFNFLDLPLLQMKQFFNCNDDSLLDLLKSIFKFQSQKRQTTQNFLASKYFDELRDKVRFNKLKKNYNIANLFDFSNHLLEKNKIVHIIPEWYNKK